MRHASLKQNFLCGVSFGAVIVAIAVAPKAMTLAVLERGASSLMARVGLWLRLLFGLSAPRCEGASLPQEDYALNRQKRRAFAHRAKRRAYARKAPAHDLEMLMAFAPGARRGLTLNQYRERFTRISVLGRIGIYHHFVRHRIGRQRIVRARMTLRGSMGVGRGASCSAPLWPD